MPKPELVGRLFTPTGEGEYQFGFTPTSFDEEMMGLAIQQAEVAIDRGDIPVGAVLVCKKSKDASGIFAASSTEFTDQDLTAHAEVNAYKKAQSALGRDLGSCALYITVEPCIACTYYIYKGEVGSVLYAADRTDAPLFFRQRSVDFTDILKESGRTTMVVSGLRKSEALSLLRPEYRKR